MDIINIDFDSLKKDSWSDQEMENAKLLVDFVQHLMNNHDFDHVMNTFNNDAYIQHNRNLPEGIAGVVGVVKQFAKRYPDYTYDVKHILADGDYVSFHSHATINKKDRGNDKKGLNIKDTWKIKDGKIVEHWDAIQPMDGFMRFYTLLTGGTIRNGNGVY
ncbi:MAG: nuclear transport factor 2 family protein [Chloroflexota bacterium]